MKSAQKKKSTKNIPKKIKEEKYQDELDIPSLKKYLESKIPHFTALDYNIIFTIFGSKEQEYLSLIDNVRKENRSDSIICYGNNNQVLKVFIDNQINNYSLEINIIKIEINGYFDTNEETLLKDICNHLNLSVKAGYDNYRKALDKFFTKKTQDDTLIIIYCDYIEHLVQKKKQRLLYTLFELVNKSRNILFIGFTYNYNLMDQMEKRIRSRSSQKTMYINIEDYQKVLNALEKAFTKNSFLDKDTYSNDESSNNNEIKSIEENYSDSIGKNFYDCLINEENGEYIYYLQKMVKMGMSIEVIFMIKKITNNIINNERSGYTYNMLVNCTKFQLTLFICLTSCVGQKNDKILLSTFYNQFKKLTTQYQKGKRSDFDLILVQKFLEDLNNCNLISIKNDEKYGKTYQLKLPLCEIKKILKRLKENHLLDNEMIKLCENIKG